jgi:hypothetical protein
MRSVVRIDRRRDDVDATTSATALAEGNQPERPTNIRTTGSPQLSVTRTFFQRLSITGTDRSLVPRIDQTYQIPAARIIDIDSPDD